MPKKKKQHYVPKMYMDLFANANKEFALYNLSSTEIRYPVPYKGQCYKDYYYGKDQLWEDRLARMESTWRETMNLIKDSKPLDAYHLRQIKTFALYQRQRTFAEGQYNKQVREEIAIECGKLACANKGVEFTENIKKLCLERAQVKATPAEHLQLASELVDVIDDLSVLVVNYETSQRLISSDVPVVAINPFELHSIGYGCMGIILLFPITPHQLVVIYDAKMYPRFAHKQYISMSNENEVRRLNILQLISAEKTLFALDASDFPSFTQDEWKIRAENRRGDAICSLGSATEKMIATSPRKVIYNCEFTFGKVLDSFAKIPYACREAVPRAWEAGWEKKLLEKGPVFTAIANHEPKVLHSTGLSQKEFRRGCQSMLQAAKYYWKQTSQ